MMNHRINKQSISPMRIRPFFWFLLVLACASVLIFAAIGPLLRSQPKLQMQIDPQLAIGMTTLELQLTDSQGMPINEAEVLSSARMTNMQMAANSSHVDMLGNGKYQIHLHLEMGGPWAITVMAYANGFEPLQQIYHFDVAET